jgi:hypothetical protein
MPHLIMDKDIMIIGGEIVLDLILSGSDSHGG